MAYSVVSVSSVQQPQSLERGGSRVKHDASCRCSPRPTVQAVPGDARLGHTGERSVVAGAIVNGAADAAVHQQVRRVSV